MFKVFSWRSATKDKITNLVESEGQAGEAWELSNKTLFYLHLRNEPCKYNAGDVDESFLPIQECHPWFRPELASTVDFPQFKVTLADMLASREKTLELKTVE
jgi:hypothetical protein